MGLQVQFFVETLSGKSLCIRMDSDSTIEDLKRKIQDLEKVRPREQRLIYQGKQLEEGNTLNDYKVSNDSKIRLVLRLLGGL